MNASKAAVAEIRVPAVQRKARLQAQDTPRDKASATLSVPKPETLGLPAADALRMCRVPQSELLIRVITVTVYLGFRFLQKATWARKGRIVIKLL